MQKENNDPPPPSPQQLQAKNKGLVAKLMW